MATKSANDVTQQRVQQIKDKQKRIIKSRVATKLSIKSKHSISNSSITRFGAEEDSAQFGVGQIHAIYKPEVSNKAITIKETTICDWFKSQSQNRSSSATSQDNISKQLD